VALAWKGISAMHILRCALENPSRSLVAIYRMGSFLSALVSLRPPMLTRNSAIPYLSTSTVAPVTSTIRGVPSEVVLNERTA
jgi:hypothetical protein